MPKIYDRNCDYCGIKYKKPARKFCSLRCSYKYSSEHPNSGCFKRGHKLRLKPTIFRYCLFCNKRFEVNKNNPKTKYCSHRCSVDHLFRGKKLSEEHKRKIKENHARHWASHKMSEEHIKKFVKALKPYQSGKGHWNWKGGITPILKKFRIVSKYQKWRKAVFERDNYTCKNCKKRGGKIVAHHIIPFATLISNKNWSLLWDLDNGITYCTNCHKETDSYARRFSSKTRR